MVLIRFYEWLAGKLIVRSCKARARRGGPDDAHEMRHLLAAVTAGNSDPCDGGRSCHLDAALMQRLHDANFGRHPRHAGDSIVFAFPDGSTGPGNWNPRTGRIDPAPPSIGGNE